jgi:hypothetical protein
VVTLRTVDEFHWDPARIFYYRHIKDDEFTKAEEAEHSDLMAGKGVFLKGMYSQCSISPLRQDCRIKCLLARYVLHRHAGHPEFMLFLSEGHSRLSLGEYMQWDFVLTRAVTVWKKSQPRCNGRNSEWLLPMLCDIQPT